jgi:hypothetical protein
MDEVRLGWANIANSKPYFLDPKADHVDLRYCTYYLVGYHRCIVFRRAFGRTSLVA